MSNLSDMYDSMANSHLKLRAGIVHCHECGRTVRVDSAHALRTGWPKCCGYTMSLDTPEERKAAP